MRSRRKWWLGGGAQSRKPKRSVRKLSIERWGGSPRSLTLETLEDRAMLSGHPLAVPLAHVSSAFAAQKAPAPISPVGVNAQTSAKAASAPITTGTWTTIAATGPDPGDTQAVNLLSNGSVLVQEGNDAASNTWYELTPNAAGSYANGTWTQLASSNVQRLYFPSAVLPSGNVFVVGGEYSGGNSIENDNNSAEMYIPSTNTWVNLPNFPQSAFGDDPIELINDGNVLAGYLGGPQTYIFNTTTNTWSAAATKLYNDQSDEETWIDLPDGSILDYSLFSSITNNVFQAQRYIPSTNTWVDASTVSTTNPPSLLSTANVGFELGPGFLEPNGNVILFGATGATAIYDPTTGIWSAGPQEPTGLYNGVQTQLGATDDPGAMMENGDILITLSPLDNPFDYPGPTYVYEFNPTAGTYTNVTPAAGLPNNTFTFNMLDLPNGQVMLTSQFGPSAQFYTPVGLPQATWRPFIAGITYNSGTTYTLNGFQLNGISEGAVYGDDNAMDTNYPIVQLTSSTGVVTYATTSNWSSTGVATGLTPESTEFTLPAGLPMGAYTLDVIANGIPSLSVVFTIGPDMTVSGNGNLITYGSTTTSATDATDFGTTYDDGGTVFETYTIKNVGLIDTLDLVSPYVTVTSTSAVTGFSVASEPASDALAPGQSTTFTIEFQPNSVGVATANVEIYSNDEADPVPFLFKISGTALAATSGMEVEGNGQKIVYNESSPSTTNDTNFGTVLDNGATASETFTILSDGHNLPLNISSLVVNTVSGNGGFTVTTAPATSTPAGSSTTFTIQFAPTAPGLVVADVVITSTDQSNPVPFVFEISGMGVNPPPTIVAEIDNSNTTGFSTTGTWTSYSAGVNGSELYAAAGTGASQANYSFSGLTPGQYEILSSWAPLPNAASNSSYTFYDGGKPIGGAVANQSVAPNGTVDAGWEIIGLVNVTSTSLSVSLTNNAGGLVIADAIEIGELVGVTLKNPELAVSDNLTAIPSNATPELANGTNFGSVATGATGLIHTFTLTNTGLSTLTFGSTPLRAVGTAFTVVTQPGVSSLAAGASTTFQVKFASTVVGSQTGSVLISTNDPDYPGGFELYLQGTGAKSAAAPTAAQIGLTGNGASIADNATPQAANGTNFGGATVTTGSVVETFTITNTGGSTLTLTGANPVTVSGASFSLIAQPSISSLAPGASVSFQVKFKPTGTGTQNGTISITNSDAALSPFVIKIDGTGVAAANSQIAVSDNSVSIMPAGTPEMTNGTNFGSATEVTGSVTNTYTITNNGTSTLTLTGVSPVSTTGSAFSVGMQPGSDAIAPGGSTTFTVIFSPTTVGLQTGTVTIASNDPTNGSFTFAVQGTGIASLTSLPTIIDDSGSGISLAGTWKTLKSGFDGGEHYATAGTGSLQALYSFTGLTAGTYQIYATWGTFGAPSAIATNTPYTFYNGAVVAGTATVNQQILPSGASFDNTAYQLIGTVNLTSALLRVAVTNKANGLVLADGIAIVRTSGAVTAVPKIALSGDGVSITTSGAAETANGTSFGSVTENSGAAYQTFTITNNGNTTLSLLGSFPVTISGAGFKLLGEPSVDSLAPGASVTFQVEFAPTAAGVDNGTITVASNDPTTPNFTFNIQGTGVPPTGDLSITKTDNGGGSSVTATAGSVTAGGTIVYTIVVANSGPNAAIGATVADTMPTSLTADTFTVATTGGASDTTNATTGAGNINDIVNLPAGSTITYTVTASVGTSTTGTMTNTAAVTAPANFTDLNLANNTATDTDNFVADLAVTKTDNVGGSSVTSAQGTATAGGTIIYTIVVTNNGPNLATGATLTDTLPSGITGDTFTVATSGGAVDTTNATTGTGNISDTVNLPSGSTITYTVTASVSATATGTLTNTATVTAPANVVDTNLTNDSATDNDTV